MLVFNNFRLIKYIMNKAAAAGIGIAVVLIAVSVLFAMTQSEESDMQTEISDETVTAEESKSYEVNLSEDLDVGDAP
tara:strand:+ start:476 stop:706 length:231 start_codon:yes stop_codon:yes gene_type:complete